MSLIAELKRRNVFKVGAAYLVVGWLLIQVSSTVAPQLNLPEWAPRLITFVLMLGFPVALLLAWIFDLTPDGVRLDAAAIGNKRMYAIAAVLLLAAIGWYWKGTQVQAPAESDARSIAVLPFVNMSEDTGNEYFSDGISEEILNVLARTPDLHVAARTSSFSFRKQEKEIPTIARELKVRMVLEGSVRKQADRVRITAQLIDASNGFHVWSQTYDRKLSDIFAIQDEIAKAIGAELQLKLAPGKAEGTPVADTKNLEAYDLYLKGMGLWFQRGDRNLAEAEHAFTAALAKDPDYAKAWSGLALVNAILSEWSTRPLSETRPAGIDAAQHAIALDPSLPEPYAALGYIAATEYRFKTSRALFKRALALSPSYATGYQWAGESLQYEGDLQGSAEMLRRAAELDPKSAIVNSVFTTVLNFSGHEDEALARCDALVSVTDEWCPVLRFNDALARRDFATARKVLEPSAARRGPKALEFFHAQMDVLDGKGNVDVIAKRMLELPDGQAAPTALSPLGAPDAVYWYVAAGRPDLAAERLTRYLDVLPYNVRLVAFDPHLGVLHCEPKFVELLRSLKVEEPYLTAPCPKPRG
jgi:TolB-like protein